MKRLGLLCGLLSLLSAPLKAAPVALSTIKGHLVRWEGYRLTPYRDGPKGWSVGVGHSLTANRERVKARYTRAEVERMFVRDVSWALDAARKGVRGFDDLPEAAQLVAIGLAFTTGRAGFECFSRFRLALSYSAFDLAASELRHSKWATQVSPTRSEAYIQALRALPQL